MNGVTQTIVSGSVMWADKIVYLTSFAVAGFRVACDKRNVFASRVSTDRQGLFVTTVVAGWLISSCALTFWICAA